jgi:hypothetical protein
MLGLRQRKSQLEIISMAVLIVGILMLVQPLALVIYSYGFTVLLVGLIAYIVVSHF